MVHLLRFLSADRLIGDFRSAPSICPSVTFPIFNITLSSFYFCPHSLKTIYKSIYFIYLIIVSMLNLFGIFIFSTFYIFVFFLFIIVFPKFFITYTAFLAQLLLFVSFIAFLYTVLINSVLSLFDF